MHFFLKIVKLFLDNDNDNDGLNQRVSVSPEDQIYHLRNRVPCATNFYALFVSTPRHKGGPPQARGAGSEEAGA